MMYGNMMYLRPGNLIKVCDVSRLVETIDHGYMKSSYQKTGEQVRGVISQSTDSQSERTKHLWDQDKHSLSHTMVVKGKCHLQRGDIICTTEDDPKIFLVLAVDDVAEIGLATLVYLEQRPDMKE